VTSADYSTAQRLNVIAPNPRWPVWSPDGRHLAFVDSDSRFSLDSGKNLWVVKPDGTGLHPITGLMGLDGFRHGAIWAPAGDALIGAGIIASSSGIWIIPLSEDRSMCSGQPRRLLTAPGDPINFVGSIHLPPPPPQLFVRRDAGGVTIYWRRTVIPYVLEYVQEPNETANWSAVSGSFQSVGEFSEYFVPNGVLVQAQFFRLRIP
jgi:hypothetical protein